MMVTSLLLASGIPFTVSGQFGASNAGQLPVLKPLPQGLSQIQVIRSDMSIPKVPAVTSGIGGGEVRATAAQKKVLVAYDNSGQFGPLGEFFSILASNILSHFDVKVTRLPVQNYTAGLVNTQDAVVYLGVVYDNPLPATFKSDMLNTSKPIVWTGYNLWQIAWTADQKGDNATFVNKFGLRYRGIDSLGYPTVNYKSTDLVKEQADKDLSKFEIASTTKAKILATSKRQDTLTTPYLVRSGNAFFVADNPLACVSLKNRRDRMLAFCDILHDVLATNAVINQRAVVRIEDVDPTVDPVKLRALADIMSAEKVPYVVSVIPVFNDPNGVLGTPGSVKMTDRPDFIQALKYMESKGGQIILHGFTHQYRNLQNPYTGVSGEDYEFFRATLNPDGTTLYQGQAWEDSTMWADSRVTAGLDLLKQSGFASVKGWLTPHYLASAIDYGVFASRFNFSMCQNVTFVQAPAGKVYMGGFIPPYVTRDQYGTLRIPETLGYVEPGNGPGEITRTVADILADAKANKVVRDGWAGFFFHHYLPTTQLQELVKGIKAAGYTFTNPTGATR